MVNMMERNVNATTMYQSGTSHPKGSVSNNSGGERSLENLAGGGGG